jgi:peptidoglycan/LPS O-acetylase OafA/YrhL
MYVGGGYTALTGIAGAASGAVVHSALLAAYGALFAGLGFAVSKRRRWARNVVLVLCGIGAALGLVTIIGGSPTTGLGRLAWPLVYAILLLSSSARVWFAARPVPEA